MKSMVMTRIGVLVSAAVAACVLLPVFPGNALAQGFVTGSANTDGFSIVGWLRDIGNRLGRGDFTIIVHRDSVDGATVAVVCNYEHFDDVMISGNIATFHSVGSCLALTDSGTTQAFTLDNTFTIVDKGEPGPDNDSVDVNLASGTGITIRGSLLVDGNFIVSPDGGAYGERPLDASGLPDGPCTVGGPDDTILRMPAGVTLPPRLRQLRVRCVMEDA